MSYMSDQMRATSEERRRARHFTEICMSEPLEIIKKFQSENEILQSDYEHAFNVCCLNDYRSEAEWILTLGVIEISPEIVSFEKLAKKSRYDMIKWLLDHMDFTKNSIDNLFRYTHNYKLAKILLDRIPKLDHLPAEELFRQFNDEELINELYKRLPIDLEELYQIFLEKCISNDLVGAKIFHNTFRFDIHKGDDNLLRECFCSDVTPHDVITWLLANEKFDTDLINTYASRYTDKEIELLIKQGYVATNKILIKRYTEYAKKHLLN